MLWQFIEAINLINILCLQVVEKLINQALTLQPNLLSSLHKHEGKVIKLIITDLLTCYLSFIGDRLILYSTYGAQADTTIKADLVTLLKSMTQTQVNALTLEGDSEFAQDLQKTFKKININFEDYLAYLTGDAIAYRIGKTLRQTTQVITHVHQRNVADLRDYIIEEKRIVPTREEIEDFYDDVSALRHDIDRLDARLQRLMDKK